MRKNITTRIAAGAAAAGLAAAMIAVGGGAASAAPITGSADAVAGFVNGLGLAQVAKHKDVNAPDQKVTVNDDGTVTLSMKNLNERKPNQEIRCQVGIFPALEAPGDGVPGSAGVATFASKWNGAFDGEKPETTEKLSPGVYAVSSSCSVWEHDASQLSPTSGKLIGTTANQPHYFVTLGGLL